MVRIWQKSGFNQYIILHELVNHKSFVNCLEFDIDGQVLLSGDQEGAIRVWESRYGTIHKLRRQERGRGLAKCLCYYISLCSKLAYGGGEGGSKIGKILAT